MNYSERKNLCPECDHALLKKGKYVVCGECRYVAPENMFVDRVDDNRQAYLNNMGARKLIDDFSDSPFLED